MTKEDFIIDQIKPYFNNPEMCGYDYITNRGYYKTDDGRMCVFGKNLAEYKTEYEGKDAHSLLHNYGEDILKPESRGILTPEEWLSLQYIHDSITEFNIIYSKKLLKEKFNITLN